MILLAWLVHLYTASGFLLAFLATVAVVEHDYRRAFLWLWLQVAVDATDGLLARAVGVSHRLAWFNGSKLDDLVDYLTYAFVPALIVWHDIMVPSSWAVPVAALMLISSGYGFCRADAKTPDHYFTGFPSYWNVVVLYLYLLGAPTWVSGVVLAGLGVLVFVPIRFVYPSRTPVLPVLTNVLGGVWASLVLALIWRHPQQSVLLLAASFVFPVYYVGLSLWLERTRGTGAEAHG